MGYTIMLYHDVAFSNTIKVYITCEFYTSKVYNSLVSFIILANFILFFFQLIEEEFVKL